MSTSPDAPGGGRPRGPARAWAAFQELPDSLRVSSYVASGLVLALVAALALAVVVARRPLPQTDGSLTLAGLGAPVRVLRDAQGVPHLYGESVADLALAQGYLTAQERFFQMDVRRLAASGRLAEVAGPDAVRSDATARTLGLRRVAEQELGLVEPDTRALLTSYAAGVNAYLDEADATELSLEYSLLSLRGADYRPEEWSPVDSLTWFKATGWDLGGSAVTQDAHPGLAQQAVGSTRAAQLWPGQDAAVDPVVGQGAVVDGRYEPDASGPGTRNPERPAWTADQEDALAAGAEGLDALTTFVGRGSGAGSNAWAVSGDRTASGEPLLALDPHLAVGVPGPWMQMGLHCQPAGPACSLDVAGVTSPGVPGVLMGHNADVAWGAAALGADTADLVVERLREGRFRYDRRWRPLRERTEVLEVAGGDDVELVVRSTRNGPLLSDVDDQLAEAGLAARPADGLPEQDDVAVSLRWTGLDPRPSIDAVLGLATASGPADFRAAVADWEVPAQAFVYADAQGRVAAAVGGAVPLRKAGDGRTPVAGWRSQFDWSGDVPSAALPYVVDPEGGVVVAANQRPVGGDYDFSLAGDVDPGIRAERIRDLLEGSDQHTVETMREVQRDDLDPFASTLVPLLLEIDLPGGSAAAAYTAAVWRALLARTFHDELPQALWPDGGARWEQVVGALLAQPDDPWWDDVATDEVEDRDDVLEAALLDARDDLTRRQARDATAWTWGHQHRLRLAAELGAGLTGDLGRWLTTRDEWEVGGGSTSVDATSWDAREGYDVTLAPSVRMILTPGDWEESRWVALTGVSGHPGSDHYTDQTDLWVAGDDAAFPFSLDAVEEVAEDDLLLEPPG